MNRFWSILFFLVPIVGVVTTVVEGTVNGFPVGRRTLKAWGRGEEAWFRLLHPPATDTNSRALSFVGDGVVWGEFAERVS